MQSDDRCTLRNGVASICSAGFVKNTLTFSSKYPFTLFGQNFTKVCYFFPTTGRKLHVVLIEMIHKLRFAFKSENSSPSPFSESEGK